jgi:rhodanese-related sulfurtransferase
MQELVAFATRHPFLVMAAALLLAMLVAHELRLLTRKWREIDAPELTRLVNGGALLIDVRETGPFRAGHIAGARNHPLATLSDDLSKLGDKARQVIVYCDIGAQSGKAAALLTNQGFTSVASLRGGLGTWQADNLPLARGLAGKGKD